MSWEAELHDFERRIKQAAYERLEDEDGFVGTEAECNIASDVDRAFGRFAEAHWVSCDHIQDKLHEANNHVTHHVNDHLSRALDSLATWTDPVGDAVKGYLGACSTAVIWRVDYIQAMKGIAALQGEVIKTTRRDVRMIAEATIEALEHRATISLSDVYAIAGAVTTIIVTVTGSVTGTGAVAGFMIADKVRSVLAEGADIAENLGIGRPGIEGGDTFEILASAFSNLDDLRRAVQQREEVVRDALKGVFDTYEEWDSAFFPTRPPVDMWSSEQLRTLVPGLIQDAGELLPTIAADNRAAAVAVASAEGNEPYAFEGDLHDPPKQRWRARRQELHDMLESTATELDSISATLIAIASRYQGMQDTQDQIMHGVLAQVSDK